MTPRTFVVTVSEEPARVVVEDVRARRREVADDLDAVGSRIASWLGSTAADAEPAPASEDAP